MSANDLCLKRNKDAELDINSCIICQIAGGSLVSTENGRKNIINAAEIRKDDVFERLKSTSIDENFSYHVNNQCYKRYVHKKSLDGIMVRFIISILETIIIWIYFKFLKQVFVTILQL